MEKIVPLIPISATGSGAMREELLLLRLNSLDGASGFPIEMEPPSTFVAFEEGLR